MGFRFRRSFKLLPGVRLNVSSRGTSVSLGGRGFHYNIGPKGTRVTAGIPGTGLSCTNYQPYAHNAPDREAASPPAPVEYLDQPYQPDQLTIIQNASAAQINALSTSQLAPILNSVSRRIQLAPTILAICLLLFIAALMQTEQQRWMALTALFATVFVPITIFLDRYRRSAIVTFDPEGLTGRISEALSVAFVELTKCAAAWTVEAEAQTTDWKRNAGATGLNKRKATSLRFGKPDCLRGKVVFPTFRVGSDQLYLLPDAALVVVRGEVASVSYGELEFSSSVVRFIEEERPPSDATIVAHTWRYVNKSGGPDRRFINNAQLPICLYGELTFRSAGGLNCKLHISAAQAPEPLCRVIDALKRTLIEVPTPITCVSTARRWPTVALLSSFACLTLLQAGFLQRDIRIKLANNGPNSVANDRQPSPAPPTSRDSDTPPKTIARIVPPQKPSLPADLNQPPAQIDPPTNNSAMATSVQAFDLSDPQNIILVQSRLRELGFLQGPTKGWDSFSRSALRDFKATNNLALDDKWDPKTQELLTSGLTLRVEQTFVGSWSESACDDSSKPDLSINSRRAVSSAGGICEFLNIRRSGSIWNVATACSNAGEKWKASVQLTVTGDKLVWTGRDGSRTEYQRCR
ncbi:hypothetical protein ABID59_001106 [Bradyrhizobium sp. S3.3.6]|uniref:DUF4236 domain-containing protein n=1 Tax=Bradyrhizobium sp. S3.3.6 TaxID=3156429 RepID=UPI003398E726